MNESLSRHFTIVSNANKNRRTFFFIFVFPVSLLPYENILLLLRLHQYFLPFAIAIVLFDFFVSLAARCLHEHIHNLLHEHDEKFALTAVM